MTDDLLASGPKQMDKRVLYFNQLSYMDKRNTESVESWPRQQERTIQEQMGMFRRKNPDSTKICRENINIRRLSS
jgi:hypothetical protein